MMRFIKYILCDLLLVFFPICSYATIMSESMIKEFAKALEQKGNGQYDCYADHRTLVFEFYLSDNSYLKEMDRDKIANNIEDELATMCATNFINVRYIVHYWDNAGNARVKQVNLGASDFLGFNGNKETFSTKSHPKAYGVNLTMTKPKGWTAEEGDGPHIVQKFIVKQGGNYTSYMIQMNEMPTFISKREARDIFSGKDGYGIDLDEWTNNLFPGMDNVVIISTSDDVVGNYPARRVEYKYTATKQGLTLNIYGVSWMIFYEDVYITLYGAANTDDPKEMKMFGNLFNLITTNVHFYDQYNDKNYGN